MKLALVNEGWDDGPTSRRELREPTSKTKKDNVFYDAAFYIYLFLFLVWEIASAFGKYLWRLMFKPEPKSLKGRVCLVTGSGRGLGRELCLALAREGAILACVDINEPNNKTTAAMIDELGAKAVPYTVNIAIKKDVEELVAKVEKELGPVYLLINNAALAVMMPKTDEEFIRASFNINVFGPIWMMNAVLPSMELKNEGHIVNISSFSAKVTLHPLHIYGATKTSLSYIGKCVRANLQASKMDNINVTNVYPSFMNTSEDYLRFVSLKMNLVLEMKTVVKETMNAIHYNYEEVIVPSYYKFPFMIINELMPTRTVTKMTEILVENMAAPSEEQWKLLPWNDLINECSFVEKRNGYK